MISKKIDAHIIFRVRQAMEALATDAHLGQEFRQQDFATRWAMARDMVNMRRTSLQEWRFILVPLAGIAGWILNRWLGN